MSVLFLLVKILRFCAKKIDKIMQFLTPPAIHKHSHQYADKVWCEFGNDSLNKDRDMSLLRTS